MHLEVPVGAHMLRFLAIAKCAMKSLFSNQRAQVNSQVIRVKGQIQLSKFTKVVTCVIKSCDLSQLD